MKAAQYPYPFDFDYCERLRDGDPLIREHFAGHFGRRLDVKLRSCIRDSAVADDLRQETLERVLTVVRNGGPQEPYRFEAFVNAVGRNVLLEYWRSKKRYSVTIGIAEGETPQDDPEQQFRKKEAIGQLTRALGELPLRDREVLRLVFLEERSDAESGGVLNVSRPYLRVLVHRAIIRLRGCLLASNVPISLQTAPSGRLRRTA